jgi:hypothetical protein
VHLSGAFLAKNHLWLSFCTFLWHYINEFGKYAKMIFSRPFFLVYMFAAFKECDFPQDKRLLDSSDLHKRKGCFPWVIDQTNYVFHFRALAS